MNGTTLKTLRQSLFMSQNEAAALNGVALRTWREFEAPASGVPADIQARMRGLDQAAQRMADEAMKELRQLASTHGAPESISLLVYSYDEELWRYRPDMAGIPHAVHTAAIDRTRRAMESTGQAVRIVEMVEVEYLDWLHEHGKPDAPDTRAAWAARLPDPVWHERREKTKPSGEQKTR